MAARNSMIAVCALSAAAVCASSGGAAEFSKAGYWEAEGSPRRVETLTAGWEFSLDKFKTSKRVSLPHSIDEGELGFEASGCVNRQQPAWYRRSFGWKKRGERQFLHFEAIMGKSRITLNGKVVAEHFGGYLPIHVEVTGILKEGDNLIEVWCDNSNDPNYPPGKRQDILDFTYFGGIYRDAYLIETGEAYVADSGEGGVWITSNLGDDGKWNVRADVALGGDTKGATAELYYDGERVESPFNPENPALWSPDEPNLHNLRIDVKKGGKLVDRVRVRFGIRDFEMTPNGFVLNGKPYPKKLIGANRHQDYAFIGNAMPNSLHWRDVKKFKDCGMNIFRAAHYPQDPAFMDACDEMGMFVIDATPGWQFWNRKNPAFERRVYDDIEKMVRRDRSRPSLLFWEPILNETHFPGDFTTNAVATVKRNALPPNDKCACDLQSAGSDMCDIPYAHAPVAGCAAFCREWGDAVDNWNAQCSVSRVLREWGEVAQVRQARHYQKWIADLKSLVPAHFGGCLWHGADHARGYHPDNFYGGILTYARQKKYSWYAVKAALTEKPFVFAAHEMAPYSPEEFAVFANCPYEATLMGKPFDPKKPFFDHIERKNILWTRKRAPRSETDPVLNFTATLPDGSKTVSYPSRRLSQIKLELDTEGLAPVADGGDLVAVIATLADDIGTPKRYDTETILFTLEGEADIVGENPQQTRWGEAVVLVRPHFAKTPQPLKIRAATVRRGKRVPAAGTLSFTPGAVATQISTERKTSAADERHLGEVEAQQEEFEAK